ncbi:MAG: DUF4383 domain-containing protein, partial [Actinomycetota bacterium]|nr:DUF4383 domain-containing protein [Actinomycetota bacterium]
MDELRETPEVLYGAALALAIVLVLTPAVGGMARRIGAVDEPARRRLNALPIPRLGGLALLLAGAFGFLADSSFDTGDAVQGGSFLGFEVNAIHNLIHLASGLVLLAASRRRGPARSVAIGFGVVYGAVAVIGLIDGSDVLGLI